MRIDILTVFPEMFDSVLNTSILGRARKNGLIDIRCRDIRPFSDMKHKNTDDYPFGGGAGMLMTARPIAECIKAVMREWGDEVREELNPVPCRGKRIYMSPRGVPLTQELARSLSREESLMLLCGHYEGVDQRVLDKYIDMEISVGDYVLTGGEVPAMILTDCISRLIPGVLGSEESPEEESFSGDGLLEYPQYTRPREFEGMSVPQVLLDGDHKKIAEWRRRQSIRVTWERRPELLDGATLNKKEAAFLRELKEQAEKDTKAAAEETEREAKKSMDRYDYLIVGAGLYGAVCARELTDAGKRVLVIDKRDHIAGNIYTEEVEGIQVHRYGAHIFHTSDRRVWDWVNRFASFNNYINSPVARYHNELYNLPFNMNTFTKLWSDVFTPADAQKRIEEQRAEHFTAEPKNLEEQAIDLVGPVIYEKLVKEYTEKQWGRPCTELPAFIIRRLPVRFTFDNNYFNDRWQGIPEGGYTRMTERILEGIEVRTGIDFLKDREELSALADRIIYTGSIDAYFDYRFGPLEYRSVRFETETLDIPDFQGNAVVNYTSHEVPYTRIIEHKHFEFGKQEKTVISREYSAAWKQGDEPYYPVNNAENNALYEKYAALAGQQSKTVFGGRLGLYRYYDMDKVIAAALDFLSDELR